MTPENPEATVSVPSGLEAVLPPDISHPRHRGRTVAIIGGLILLACAAAYFGRNYIGNLSGANHYVEPYTLVADSISESASIIINLPAGISEAEAAGNVTFNPAISGKWIASKSADQMVFQPDQELPLGKYFTATLAVNGAALSKDFLIAGDPKVVAVFPATSSEASEFSNITIAFSRPMVPLTVLDAFTADAAKFVDITPATHGKFKWIDTRDLQFIPDTNLIASANYTVHIKPGFISIEGLSIPEATYHFVTRNLRYVNNGSKEDDPQSVDTISFDEPFRILFNQAVDLKRTEAEISITDAQGKKVPVTFAYGTRAIPDQNGNGTTEVTDQSIIEIYGAKDKSGRANYWDFGTNYNYQINHAYPVAGDINLDASQSGSFAVAPIITDVSADSPRSDGVAADVFDPQGKLIFTFGEPINKDRSSISAPHLTGVDYGQKCKVDSDGDETFGADGQCEKETDYQKIELSFASDTFAPGDSIPVQFKQIVGQDGVRVNSGTLTETATVYPRLKVISTSPATGATNAASTGVTICTNTPLTPATEDNFSAHFKTNFPTGAWDWNDPVRVTGDEPSPCAVGEFENTIVIGLAPQHDIHIDLHLTDDFGQTADTSLDFETGAAPAESRNFYQMQKVYDVTSPDRTELTYAVENLPYVDMNICQVTAAQMFKYLANMPTEEVPASNLNCVSSLNKQITLPDRYWTRNYFQVNLSDYIPNPLGHYVLTFSNPDYHEISSQWDPVQQQEVPVEGQQLYEKTFVTVTNLAVQEKNIEWNGDQASNYDPDPQATAQALQGLPQNLYWVTRFGSQDPVAGAAVSVWQIDASGNASQVDSAITDSDGVARATVHPSVKGAIVTSGDDSAIVSEDTDYFQYTSQANSSDRVYIYTDRPIYRPGQDVFVKGLDRVGYDGDYQVPAAQNTQVTIKNNAGDVVYQGTVAMSDFGTFTTHFTLDTGAPLGTYSIEAGGGYGTFDVEDYVGSPFKVDVASDKPEYVAGDTATMSINANYFFGVPVDGGQATYAMTSQDYYFDRYQDQYFSFGSGWYDNPEDGYGDNFIAQGKVSLSKDGKGSIVQSLDFSKLFKPSDATQSKIITLNVTVKNSNGQSVSAQESFIVHRGEFYVGVSMDKTFLGKGDAFTARVKTVDTQGKPVSVPKVTMTINRVTWTYSKRQEVDGNYYYQDQKNLEFVTKADVSTDGSGDASHDFSMDKEGEYQLTLSSTDSRGNPITAEQDFYVYGPGEVQVQELNNETLELATDKQTLNVGDTANVIIKSPFPQAKALITLERGKIFDYKIVNITGNLYDYSFKVDPAYVPNIYLSVLLLSPRPDVKFGQIDYQINTDYNALGVDISTDKASYLPGETVNLSLSAHDSAGHPEKAELSVAVADLSVLALEGNPKKNPLAFFYDGFPLSVITASNVKNILYEASIPNGTKGGGGGGNAPSDLAAKKRGVFKDTAVWQSDVLTDDSGHATLSFTLPDNLTTWQIESVGITADTKVGVGYKEFTAQKDVMVVPLAPRFVVPGDQFSIGAEVFNQTDSTQKLTISFDSQTLQPKGKTSTTISLAAKGTYTAYFPVTAPAADGSGSHTFTLSAINDQYNDTVETTIPITANQTYETVATANYTTESTAQEYVLLPDTIVPGRGGMTIKTSATLAVFLSDALDYIFTYPYGGSEQVASRLSAIAIARRGLGVQDLQKTFTLPGVTFEDSTYSVDDVMKLGLSRIYENQTSDGGISYYPDMPPDYSLTLSVLNSLIELRNDGYQVDDQVIASAAQYIFKSLSTDPNIYQDKDLVILSAYTLSRLPEYQGNSLLASSISAIVADQSFMHDSISSESLAYLAMIVTNGYSSSVTDAVFTDLENRLVIDARGTHLGFQDANVLAEDYETPVKDTALFLKAYADAGRDNSELPNVIRWIAQSRSPDGAWGSVDNTAAVIDAFTDYLGWKHEMQSTFALALNLDGKQIASYDFDGSTILTTFSQFLPISDFTTDAIHTIAFEKQASSTFPNGFYYDMSLQYYLSADQVPPRNEGFGVQRAFYALDDATMQHPLATAHQGDVLRGHLTIVVPETRQYVTVEDYIPAGMELVDFNLATEDQTLQTRTESQGSQGGFNIGSELGQLVNKIRSFFGFGTPSKALPVSALSADEMNALVPDTPLDPDATETHDDRVYLFNQQLAPGVYTYDYFVRALIPGTYNHLPAVVSEMYTPENFGRTGGEYFTVQ